MLAKPIADDLPDSTPSLEINAEQIKMLYAAMPTSVAANIIASSLLIYAQWSVIDHVILISWFSLSVFIILLRTLLSLAYTKAKPDIHSAAIWGNRFTIGSSASGLMLGLAGIFLFPENQPVYQMMCAFVLIGMASGAVSSLSFGKYTFPLYAGLVFIPLLGSLVATRSDISLILIPMVVLAFAFILRSARYIYKNSRQNILFRLQSKSSEAYLSSLLKSVPVVIYNCKPDTNFTITFISENVRNIIGYEPDQFLHDSTFWGKCIHPDDTDRVFDDLKHLLDHDIHINEYRLRNKNNDYIWVHDELKVIKDHKGKPINVVGYWADITDRKNIENMKNEFISTVSHELRTPLTSIRGSLGLMKGGTAGELPEIAKNMTAIAYNNTNRLLLLINDILDMQKIESGELAFELSQFDLVELIQQSIQDNASYGEEYNVTLQYIGESEPRQVNSDYNRLMQVLANLISNAAKFSHPGGTVEIGLSRHKENVQISVKDHGMGIPKDYQPMVFEKFTQADSSDSRSKGGTGLGLAISKMIIENLQGKINFTSTQGAGTTFTVTIPAAKN